MLGQFSVSMQPNNYGKIAFSSDREGKGHQIYVMNADGSNQIRLTNGPCPQFFPAWSPDGKRIAFISACEVLQVYMIDADGSNCVNLSISLDDNGWPAWSPDGKRIALFAYRDGISGIFVMDTDGSNVVNLTNKGGLDRTLAWSPDGKKIVFTRGSNICVINSDGSNLRLIADHGSFPAWSPDGKKIAFASDRDGNWEIYVMDTDGSDVVNLTNSSAHDIEPVWSPDGKKIAFASDRDGNNEIYVMNADGSNQMNLTNNLADDRDPVWCCQSLLADEPLPVGYPFIIAVVTIVFVAILTIIFLKRTRAATP